MWCLLGAAMRATSGITRLGRRAPMLTSFGRLEPFPRSVLTSDNPATLVMKKEDK